MAVLTPQSVTASGRPTPRLVRALAIWVTRAARSRYVHVRCRVWSAGSGSHSQAAESGQRAAASSTSWYVDSGIGSTAGTGSVSTAASGCDCWGFMTTS
jgi:hypothetical protein